MILFSYDPEARACYIKIVRNTDVEHAFTEPVRDGKPMINLDWAMDASLEGIEILLPGDREGEGEE